MTEVADQENDPQIGNTTEEDDEDITEKKETFQWNTPADEFAEDVASDVEESEDEGGDASNRMNNSSSQSMEMELNPKLSMAKLTWEELSAKDLKRPNRNISFHVRSVTRSGTGHGN